MRRPFFDYIESGAYDQRTLAANDVECDTQVPTVDSPVQGQRQADIRNHAQWHWPAGIR